MPLIPSMGKDEFMERLYNEWRVEFAFEDHRFWDVRRWKIADTTQRELYGVKIEKQADGTFNFYKNLYETGEIACICIRSLKANYTRIQT